MTELPPNPFPPYRPPVEPTTRADGARIFTGISYAVISGYRPLQLDVWVPPAAVPPPLVVWIHGGAWLLGDRRYLPETLRPNQLFDALLAAGLAVATVDYRHTREAPFPAQLHDVKAALRYVRAHAAELGVDAARVGVWGESAGGHLAALLALTAQRPDLEGDVGAPGRAGDVAAVVDWYGVADPDAMGRLPADAATAMGMPDHPPDLLLAGAAPATRADAAPLRQVHPGAPPFLLMHGTADRLVPFADSEALLGALRAAGVPAELIPVEGADHIFAGYPDIDALVARSVRFLAEALAST
ncbi:alpha/beta hydrolase fold domain-containing protein [Nakamurella sp.]|uniref:alpha/beta hydrolase fold domain-containing protein n=1 Tax=Nakamurella sp. TaxID=1869182 RepID=UPI00378383C6